ncbi:hypothetical protein SLE2022_301610 [Rubroshorea leprosula]
MDDMAAYYPPPHYPYYQPPPPPQPPTVALPPPPPPPPGTAPPLHYLSYQHPPLASYASFLEHPSHNEVRTLFIAGLPEDVKAREVYNLFREFPGYESSHLRSPTSGQKSQPFAFAVFSNQQSAIAAMQAMNGMVFDLEKGSTLYIDLAKANSRSKRSRTDDEWPGSDKKPRGMFSSVTLDPGFGSTHLPGMGNSAYNMIGYPPTQSPGNIDVRVANETTAVKSNNSSVSNPCPTLFVANLGPNCTEQELIQLFSRCPGFLKLKMQSTYGSPVAFVDFQDTACSTGAMNSLQGTILYSSSTVGEGMRLEYAKSRMGMRRKPK